MVVLQSSRREKDRQVGDPSLKTGAIFDLMEPVRIDPSSTWVSISSHRHSFFHSPPLPSLSVLGVYPAIWIRILACISMMNLCLGLLVNAREKDDPGLHTKPSPWQSSERGWRNLTLLRRTDHSFHPGCMCRRQNEPFMFERAPQRCRRVRETESVE
jgi:hypothetical protein